MPKIRKCLLDYDGTLSEIQPRPEMAVPSQKILKFLIKHKNTIVLCTGRSKSVVDEWFPSGIEVFAEHGALFRNKQGKWTEPKYSKVKNHTVKKERENDNFYSKFSHNVEDILNYYHKRTPCSILERKTCGFAFHYKQAITLTSRAIMIQLYRDLSKVSDIYNFKLTLGKGVIEVKLASKGDVVKYVKPDLVAGDDVTDEEMFLEAQPPCYTIKVGNEKTRARHFVLSVDDFIEKLSKILNRKHYGKLKKTRSILL